MALGQDFHLWGQGQVGDRNWDGVMPSVTAPGHPSAPAPTCVWGRRPMLVITSLATLRAAWHSCSLALCPAEWDIRAALGTLLVSMSPCIPIPGHLSRQRPSCPAPLSSTKQSSGQSRFWLTGLLVATWVRSMCLVVSDTCPGRGHHCGVIWGLSSPVFFPSHPATLAFPILTCYRAPVVSRGAIAVSVSWPCSAPCGFPKDHQSVPGPHPTSCAPGGHHGVPWLFPASCTSCACHGHT